MKKGTHVGLDKNYDNVCVGDYVKDEAGLIYKIDAYGRAVCRADGSFYELHKLGRFELYNPDVAPVSDPKLNDPTLAKPMPEKPSEEATEEATEEERQEFMRRALEILTDEDLRNEMKKRGLIVLRVFSNATDQELAEELRRRGYDVKATKQVTVEI